VSSSSSLISRHQLLYALECGDYCDVITWSSSVTSDRCKPAAFYILDPKAFEDHVLPALFKVAKYDSFQRKLHRWGFIKKQRSRAGNTIVSYAHQLFLKGNFSLVSTMTCSGPGSASRRITSAYTTPHVGVVVSSNLTRRDVDEEETRRVIGNHYGTSNDEAVSIDGLYNDQLISSLPHLLSRGTYDARPLGVNYQQQDDFTSPCSIGAGISMSSASGADNLPQHPIQQQQQYYRSMHPSHPQQGGWGFTSSTIMRPDGPTATSSFEESRRRYMFESRNVPIGAASLSTAAGRCDEPTSAVHRDIGGRLFDCAHQRTLTGRTINTHNNTIVRPAGRSHAILSGSFNDGSDCNPQQYQQHLPSTTTTTSTTASTSEGFMDARKQHTIFQKALDALHGSHSQQF